MKRFSILVLLLVTIFGQETWAADELTAESLLAELDQVPYSDNPEHYLHYGEWGNKCPWVKLDELTEHTPNSGSIVCPTDAECIIGKYQLTAKCYCSQVNGCGREQ